MHKSSACHTISYHIMLYHTIQNKKKQSMYIYIGTVISIETSMKTLIFHDILILSPCAFDPCNDCHARGWSDRKRLGRLGQLHSISFARLREWTRRAGARGFLGSRRFHGRRKRGGLQATSCYRDQAWSHFDVGHHGIHHPSDLDLLKLHLRSFQYSMFLLTFPFLQLHFIVAESIGNLFLLMRQSPGDHWLIPWLLISICRFEVRRCA